MIFRKRPVYVLGLQAAAAKAAEAARLASGPQRPSPLPAELYSKTPDAQSLLHVDENAVDRRLRAIAGEFAAASPEERAQMTASIDIDGLYALLLFACRSAVFALRQRDLQHCVDGFRAVAMIDIARIDFRDIDRPLELLDQAAFRLGAPREPLFHAAEELASQDVAETMRNYRRVNSPSASPEDALWQLVETPEGAGFVFRVSKKYRSSTDLLPIALAMAARLRTGRHEPHDPWLAMGLPIAWFRRDIAGRGKVAIVDTLGVVSFSASLRAGFHPNTDDQYLTVFIAEMPTAERARTLAAAAEGPLKDGGAALAISDGNLLLLVVGRSIRQSVRSYETPDSVRALIESLCPLLTAS